MKDRKEPEEAERKKLEELVALYSYEPGLKDIYVEGETDKNLFEWVLAERKISDVRVYPIDIVDISEQVLRRHGLGTGSNRSCVLALSAELAESLPSDLSIMCIADRDNEDYLPSGIENGFLEFTDYNSIDLYLLRLSTFRKLISLVLGGFPLSPEQVMSQIQGVLEDVYILRAANQALVWNMQWIPFTKYLNVVVGVSFDRARFEKAYLQKNGRWAQRERFFATCKTLRSRLKADPRLRIRGHDMTELLFFIVKKWRSCRKFGDLSTFEGAFMGCLELEELCNEGLFQKVLSLSSTVEITGNGGKGGTS